MPKRKGASAGEGAPVPQGTLPRRRGRPAAVDGRGISRLSILKTSLRLCKTVPLQELSILTVARSLEIAPGLVHYYIGGRDYLTSGVINLFYHNLIMKWPKKTGNWEDDLRAAALLIYQWLCNYGGVAAYIISNSRFRIYQLTDSTDEQWGIELLERFSGCVHAAGLSAEKSAVYAHLFLEFIFNSGHDTARHIFPAEHRKYLDEKTSQLDPAKYPNIFFERFAPLKIDGAVAFGEGTRLFLLGIKTDLAEARPVYGEVAARP